jgi:hypothetical protein
VPHRAKKKKEDERAIIKEQNAEPRKQMRKSFLGPSQSQRTPPGKAPRPYARVAVLPTMPRPRNPKENSLWRRRRTDG